MNRFRARIMMIRMKATSTGKQKDPLFAKKSLGQHFLNSEGVLIKMADSCNHLGVTHVVEIGPGKGALTRKLLSRYTKVIAIEKDQRMVTFLHETFSSYIETGVLTILEDDILNLDVGSLTNEPYVVIANIPYYITGAITEHVLTSRHVPKAISFLIQKEVADRIVARDSKHSILSLSVHSYGVPKIIAKVPRGAFVPPPKVESAIIIIDRISKDFFISFTEEQFFTVVRAGFAHKRKLLIRNLEEICDRVILEDIFSVLKLSPKIRAESVSTETWQKLVMSLSIRGIL